MLRASLSMYDMLAPVQAANDALWKAVATHLRSRGLAVSDALDRDSHYHAVWSYPDLMFSQTCGYPYVRELRGKVRLVGTPIYAFAGGSGADRASFIIVSESDQRTRLEEFRGARAAINDWMSNSGMNLFRAAVAPLAGGRPFFSRIDVVGGHVASINAVREGRADIAAVDSVTWGMIARHAPDRLEGARILMETPRGPGLPFITRAATTDEELGWLRSALDAALVDPALADSLSALGIMGIAALSDGDYDRLDALRLEAEALAYPTLA